MKVRVEDIGKEEGLRLSLKWGKKGIEAFLAPKDPYNIEFIEPLMVELFFEKRSSYIHVTGHIEGQLVVTCHRCLENFGYPLDLPLETFLYTLNKMDIKEEIELEEEDLLEEFFDGEEIDVDLIISEEIFLSLPQVLLCSEECKGLCPKCGVNLNREECSCSKALDSPFAVLSKLKLKQG